MPEITRRDLLAAAPAALAGGSALSAMQAVSPVVVASANGIRGVAKAREMILAGADVLDAVIAAVNIEEDDPENNSVGFGGLPNEDGVVELDASVMHGPSRRAGAVAAIQHIKNPSKVAKAVMQRTSHLMLVGEGALRFAEAQGFERMNLLTEKSRIAWLTWKASHAPNWAPPPDDTPPKTSQIHIPGEISGASEEIMTWARYVVAHPPMGTINCVGVDAKGDLSGTTTTSGMAWKIAGRVGDSPIIGAGLFVDNEVGAAGATGYGEENIKIAGGHTVVEFMRRGANPTEACLETLKRMAANHHNDRERLLKLDMIYYACNKKGEFGSATLWDVAEGNGKRNRFSVCDTKGARLMDSTPLMQR
jgi:N4-(beta-N-acetylglucosaminyl)-L-asparaginase